MSKIFDDLVALQRTTIDAYRKGYEQGKKQEQEANLVYGDLVDRAYQENKDIESEDK